MLYLTTNLKKYRILKGLTQEELANYLNITPQSISKWERGETYPDITFLPALANIFETSVDLLIGMDVMRATLCFLYQKHGEIDKARALAFELPHLRESREVIQPIIMKNPSINEIDKEIKLILLGE